MKGISQLKNKLLTFALAASLAIAPVVTGGLASSATPTINTKKYANCTALNKVYPGGVAKTSKAKNKGGETKYKPKVSKKIYLENKAKDRDGDGIVCER